MIHEIPRNALKVHEGGMLCDCSPKLLRVKGAFEPIAVHNAWDDRPVFEVQGELPR